MLAELPPPLNAIGLANVTEMFIISEIGEIASAYAIVTIAVSNRVKRIRNGNLN